MHAYSRLLGSIADDDWLQQVKPDLEARMNAYDDRTMEFAILSLVQDPLIRLKSLLAGNVRSLLALNSCLAQSGESWLIPNRDVTIEAGDRLEFSNATIVGPDMDFGLTEDDISMAIGQFQP